MGNQPLVQLRAFGNSDRPVLYCLVTAWHYGPRQRALLVSQGTWRAEPHTRAFGAVLRARGACAVGCKLLQKMISCVQANNIDLFEGARNCTLTQLQMELVFCFAPGRVHQVQDWVIATLQQRGSICIEPSANAYCAMCCCC